MLAPSFGLSLRVIVDLLPSNAGGLSHPIVSGYRPLCVVEGPGGDERIFGLCELLLDHPLAPGDTGEGRLLFDVSVSDEVRGLLPGGSRFALAEGARQIGWAQVRGIDP
jgi:hypothetical protein